MISTLWRTRTIVSWFGAKRVHLFILIPNLLKMSLHGGTLTMESKHIADYAASIKASQPLVKKLCSFGYRWYNLKYFDVGIVFLRRQRLEALSRKAYKRIESHLLQQGGLPTRPTDRQNNVFENWLIKMFLDLILTGLFRYETALHQNHTNIGHNGEESDQI